jgi:hypothetical protein
VSARIAMAARRTYAVSAVCSAVLHGLSLAHVTHPAVATLMVTMIVACLYCARDIWLRGTLRAWVLLASMNLAMIAVHLPMAAAHHHDGGLGTVPVMPDSTLMTLATGLAVAEVVIAIGVLYHRTRAPQLVFRQP